MKASTLQHQIMHNAMSLTNMHKEYSTMRTMRATYNKRADTFYDNCAAYGAMMNYAAADEQRRLGVANAAQAEVFTPYINRKRREIARLEAVQKALKQELNVIQALEDWQKEDDAFWLSQVDVVQEEGFSEPGVVQEFLGGWRE